MEVSLLGLKKPVTVSRNDDSGGDVLYQVVEDPVATAVAFLERYKTAKIIYVIDTHALDNGFLVWKGTKPKNFQACSLDEVSVEDSHDFSWLRSF